MWNSLAGRFNEPSDVKLLNKAAEAGQLEKLKYQKHPTAGRENMVLTAKQNQADDIITGIERAGHVFTFEAFSLEYSQKSETVTAYDYFTILIKGFESENKIGNANTYRNSQSALSRFKPDLKLKDIKPGLLRDFESWLRQQPGSSSTGRLMDTSISVYMRTIRAMINKAISEGFFKAELYPFATNRNDKMKYSFSGLNTSTKKRAVSSEAIQAILTVQMKHTDKTALALDIFTFSYYCHAINFIDIAFLKNKNISDGKLSYIRRKTHEPSGNIVLNSEAIRIMSKYNYDSSKPDEYIFPILNDEIHKTEQQKYTRVKTVSKLVNSGLKSIANNSGLKGYRLTMYVGRHTLATELLRNDTPAPVIKSILIHKDLSTTQGYLDELSSEHIEQFTDRVYKKK